MKVCFHSNICVSLQPQTSKEAQRLCSLSWSQTNQLIFNSLTKSLKPTNVIMSSDSGTKTAVVTGASSGMGADAVQRLLKQGYKVVLISRNEDKMKKVIQGNEKNTKIITADLSKLDNVKPAVEKALEFVGGSLNVLICAAGIVTPHIYILLFFFFFIPLSKTLFYAKNEKQKTIKKKKAQYDKQHYKALKLMIGIGQ